MSNKSKSEENSLPNKINDEISYLASTSTKKESVKSKPLTMDRDGESLSSGSDCDEVENMAIRKVSTRKQIKGKVTIKEGYLLKQANHSFHNKWRRHYFKLRNRCLYYAKTEESEIFDEVELIDCSVAERSTKNVNCGFSIITPFHSLILSASSRREMDEWLSAIKSVRNGEFYEPKQFYVDNFSGNHNWYMCSHARPTYCNVCREVLSGVTNHGLSCEVCKFKAHKKCASQARSSCKWATLSTVGRNVKEDEEGVWISHQWLEGNLPVNAKCTVCNKACGSVLRLQDFKCLWCRVMVHSSCRNKMSNVCLLGQCKMSVVPPTSLNSVDREGYWKAMPTLQCTSPLLVFVNSKSGDNQGVKFLRRFRQYLNPAQVFDLMCTGPSVGLRMFRLFDTFRILVCGGDGSIGWVLSEMDKLNLHNKAQVGVLPLGTGNDLAQVMGWGSVCDDETLVPAIIERYERASTKLLDRWSISTYDGPVTVPTRIDEEKPDDECEVKMTKYGVTLSNHLEVLERASYTSEVLQSAAVLCDAVKDFVGKVGQGYGCNDLEMKGRCSRLTDKLDLLLKTFKAESEVVDDDTNRFKEVRPRSFSSPNAQSQYLVAVENDQKPNEAEHIHNSNSADLKSMMRDGNNYKRKYKQREKKVSLLDLQQKQQLIFRVNSLKKAVRQIVEYTETAVDEQTLTSKQCSLLPCEEKPEIEAVISSESTQQEGSRSSEEFVCENNKEVLPPTTANSLSRHSPNLARKNQKSDSSSSSSASFPLKSKLMHVNPDYSQLHGHGSFISNVLRANAETMCAFARPLISSKNLLPSMFTEKSVMNNYFGIGLDAKIVLDFHRKRDENPKKCSRTKNMMWYGMLATKEFALNTYKNLDKRIRLECDGQYIPLPPLQGIVVLNIPSFMGGSNLWGGRIANQTFMAPSYNDKILEVVAVFGTMQLGMALVVPEGILRHHRIAQCRSVNITVLGTDSVPLQVDGEAWLQPPGVIRIGHKNRAQMLCRDRQFESTLKSWEGRQRFTSDVGFSELLLASEMEVIGEFVETAIEVIKCMADFLVVPENQLATELYDPTMMVLQEGHKVLPMSIITEDTTRHQVQVFHRMVCDLNTQLQNTHSAKSQTFDANTNESMLKWIEWFDLEIKKVANIKWLSTYEANTQDGLGTSTAATGGSSKKSGKFNIKKLKKKKVQKVISMDLNVHNWNSIDICQWLDMLQLSEYHDTFVRNEIQGEHLMRLNADHLKVMGITKVGHVKRILGSIKDINGL